VLDIATIETVTIDFAAIEHELRPLSSDKLKLRFVESYGKAAEMIAQAAVCVKLLEERGESLAGVPMLGTFRRIAAGQIVPELVWKFIESPNRRTVERLPLNDQRKLASSPMVEVVEPAGTGYTRRKVDLTQAPRDVVSLAIGPDGLRTPEEQLAYLGSVKPRVAPRSKRDNAPLEPLTKSVTVRFTEAEFAAIKMHAAYKYTTEGTVIRQFLKDAGAFKRPKG
jgi:hypothetical protein